MSFFITNLDKQELDYLWIISNNEYICIFILLMKQFFWKTYASFFVFIVILTIIATLLAPQSIRWSEYLLRMLVISIATFGLCGFVWKKYIGKAWFWKMDFFSVVLVLVWVTLRSGDSSGLHQLCSGVMCSVANDFIGFMLIAPLLWGLFSYAFRSKDMWLKKFE